jgi:hypothetical protein
VGGGTIIMDLPEASHGAMLAPKPPLERGSVDDASLGSPPLEAA